jgi:hypothetical protein
MKTNNRPAERRMVGWLILAAVLQCAACAPTFQKGYKQYTRRDYASAIPIFERYRAHPKYAPAARFFLGKIQLADTRDLPGLLALDHELAAADTLFRQLSTKPAARLTRKFAVDTAAFLDLREQTQRWAVAGTRSRGTLPALDSLLGGMPRPLPRIRPEVATARTDIVNAHLETTDYDTMTAILRRYIDAVLPENYGHTRRMNDDLWPAFLQKYSPCELDRFAVEHRHTFAGRDCWREEVRALLCAGHLPDLLDFHAKNRWTALEIVLLNAVAGLSSDTAVVAELTPTQQQHLHDLRARTALRHQLINGAAARDSAATLEQVLAYITRYAPRFSAYRLLEEGVQFFLNGRYYASAIALLEGARPYFPDTLPTGCNSDFDYQRRVKPGIDGKLTIIRRPDKTVIRRPLATLNTPTGDESSPVVRSDGREILFAGKNRPDNIAGTEIFTAQWDNDKQDWGAPVLVRVFSGPGRYIPLSLTGDGLLLLLTVNDRLHTSRRTAADNPWSAPTPLPVTGIAVLGKGCLSADGNILILEGAYSAGSATQAPDLDLFVSHRDPSTGAWSTPTALGADINTDGQDTAPFLLPDNRTLFYTSTGYPGLGQGDIFTTRRTRDGWTYWVYPENMGKELNDIYPHSGFTTVAPDGLRAWMSAEGELWEVKM